MNPVFERLFRAGAHRFDFQSFARQVAGVGDHEIALVQTAR